MATRLDVNIAQCLPLDPPWNYNFRRPFPTVLDLSLLLPTPELRSLEQTIPHIVVSPNQTPCPCTNRVIVSGGERRAVVRTQIAPCGSSPAAGIEFTPEERTELSVKQRVGKYLVRLAKLVGVGIILGSTGEDFQYRTWKNLAVGTQEYLVSALNEHEEQGWEFKNFGFEDGKML